MREVLAEDQRSEANHVGEVFGVEGPWGVRLDHAVLANYASIPEEEDGAEYGVGRDCKSCAAAALSPIDLCARGVSTF